MQLVEHRLASIEYAYLLVCEVLGCFLLRFSAALQINGSADPYRVSGNADDISYIDQSINTCWLGMGAKYPWSSEPLSFLAREQYQTQSR